MKALGSNTTLFYSGPLVHASSLSYPHCAVGTPRHHSRTAVKGEEQRGHGSQAPGVSAAAGRCLSASSVWTGAFCFVLNFWKRRVHGLLSKAWLSHPFSHHSPSHQSPLPGERQAVPARLNAKCQPHVTQRLLANRGAPSGGRPGPGLVPPGPGLSPFCCHSSDYSPWEVTPLVVWVTCLELGTCQRELVFRKLEGCGRPSLSRVLGAGWVGGGHRCRAG